MSRPGGPADHRRRGRRPDVRAGADGCAVLDRHDHRRQRQRQRYADDQSGGRRNARRWRGLSGLDLVWRRLYVGGHGERDHGELDALVYTPAAEGSATTQFTLSDQSSAFGTATIKTVTIVVDPGPTATSTAPTFVAAGVATDVGAVSPGLPGDTLTLVATTAPSHGSLTLSNGEIVYQSSGSVPAGGETDSFTFEIKDQYGDLSAPITAAFAIDPVRRPTAARSRWVMPSPTSTRRPICNRCSRSARPAIERPSPL